MILFLQSGKTWAIMIPTSMINKFWGFVLKCNEQERRLFGLFIIIISSSSTSSRFVCPVALPYETQRRKDYLEKKSLHLVEKVRWKDISALIYLFTKVKHAALVKREYLKLDFFNWCSNNSRDSFSRDFRLWCVYPLTEKEIALLKIREPDSTKLSKYFTS